MWKDDVIYGLKAELAASCEFEGFVAGHVEQDGSIPPFRFPPYTPPPAS